MNFHFLFSSFNFDLYLVKKLKQKLTKLFAKSQHMTKLVLRTIFLNCRAYRQN